MSEFFRKIIKKSIEITPKFAKERVANALLKNYEIGLEDTEDINWYMRHAHGRKIRENDESPACYMGIDERVWYLLDSTPSERDDWTKLIDGISLYKLNSIASVFGYVTKGTFTSVLESPNEVRSRLFLDYIHQARSGDTELQKGFKEKFDQAAPLVEPLILPLVTPQR